MYKLIIPLCISFLILKFECSYGQVTKDTLLAQTVRALQKKLHLPADTTALLLAIHRWQAQQLDSLNQDKTLSPEQRQVGLQTIQSGFDNKLKDLLTIEQWGQLQQMRAAVKDSFQLKMQHKNIPVKELPTNN